MAAIEAAAHPARHELPVLRRESRAATARCVRLELRPVPSGSSSGTIARERAGRQVPAHCCPCRRRADPARRTRLARRSQPLARDAQRGPPSGGSGRVALPAAAGPARAVRGDVEGAAGGRLSRRECHDSTQGRALRSPTGRPAGQGDRRCQHARVRRAAEIAADNTDAPALIERCRSPPRARGARARRRGQRPCGRVGAAECGARARYGCGTAPRSAPQPR